MLPEIQPFFKSAVSVDNVIFGFEDGKMKVLLIKRGAQPYKDTWALPGNLVFEDEDLDEAAARVLTELTGLQEVYLEQVKTFGAVGRHPEGRVITVAYYTLIKIQDFDKPKPQIAFAREAKWFNVHDVGELAFDHNQILQSCIRRLKRRVRTEPIGFELLSERFTLSDLQSLYESILMERMEKRNFRKKIMSMGLLQDVGETQEGVAHRPAKLFSFDKHKYLELVEQGFSFKL